MAAVDRLPIQIWNDSPASRTVSVELLHNESSSSVVTQTKTLPPNGTLWLEIRSPGYLLKITDDQHRRRVRPSGCPLGCNPRPQIVDDDTGNNGSSEDRNEEHADASTVVPSIVVSRRSRAVRTSSGHTPLFQKHLAGFHPIKNRSQGRLHGGFAVTRLGERSPQASQDHGTVPALLRDR